MLASCVLPGVDSVLSPARTLPLSRLQPGVWFQALWVTGGSCSPRVHTPAAPVGSWGSGQGCASLHNGSGPGCTVSRGPQGPELRPLCARLHPQWPRVFRVQWPPVRAPAGVSGLWQQKSEGCRSQGGGEAREPAGGLPRGRGTLLSQQHLAGPWAHLDTAPTWRGL